MDWTVGAWIGLRILRWGAWLWMLVYSVLFLMDRDSHFDRFNQVLHSTEAMLFGCGLVGMSERADALGGTLYAGPSPAPSRGWLVVAELPLGRAS